MVRSQALFPGDSEFQQLLHICRLLGTPIEKQWVGVICRIGMFVHYDPQNLTRIVLPCIIDEKELVKCLVNIEIKGAGLDVFENKPHVPKELVAMDNFVFFPHKVMYTLESLKRGSEVLIDNLEAFFSNKPLVTPIMAE